MKRDILIIVGIALIAVIGGGAVFLTNQDNFAGTLSLGAANTQPSAVEVPLTKLVQGEQSSVTTRVNYLITSPDELKSLWSLISATGTPPAVDFKTQAVLAVFAGAASSTTIAVAKVEDTDKRLVSIILAESDSTCGGKKSATSPYELVVVPSTSLPLAHEDVVKTVSCSN